MKKTIVIPTLLGLLLALQNLVACSKSNNTNPPQPAAAITYNMVGGNCMASNGQSVPPNYCGNQGNFNGMYSFVGNICRNNQTGQQVDPYYCNNNPMGQYPNGQYPNGQYPNGQYPNGQYGQYPNYPPNGSGAGMQCVGTFYYMGNGSQQVVACNGVNCRGYTLYTAQGQAVFCQ